MKADGDGQIMIDVLDSLYTRIMDGIIEKLTLTERDIAIAEGKIIEFNKRSRRRNYKGRRRHG
jgi:hypothetical protein